MQDAKKDKDEEKKSPEDETLFTSQSTFKSAPQTPKKTKSQLSQALSAFNLFAPDQ